MTEAGSLKCWGNNQWAQLGDGTAVSKSTPIDVQAMGSGVALVSAGTDHTCAVLLDGGVRCWGLNAYGQVGDGTVDWQKAPAAVISLPAATAVAVGAKHSCALLKTGEVKCWGANDEAQLGNPDAGLLSLVPSAVIGIANLPVRAISAGAAFTCAINSLYEVYCWGRNQEGELGNGSFVDAGLPVRALVSPALDIAAGSTFVCALVNWPSNPIRCWGTNGSQELGTAVAGLPENQPVLVQGNTAGAVCVSSGDLHACLATIDGGAKCWGQNKGLQLGVGAWSQMAGVGDVIGLPGPVASVASGGAFTCALMANTGIVCWGNNAHGQLGDGTLAAKASAKDGGVVSP